MKVGLIGVGRMGQAMARRICGAGHDVERRALHLEVVLDSTLVVEREGDGLTDWHVDDARLEREF